MSREFVYVDLDAVDHYMGPQYYYEVDTHSVSARACYYSTCTIMADG